MSLPHTEGSPPDVGDRTRPPLRVLLLEDDPLDAELIQARLERDGLSVALSRVDSDGSFTQALADHGHELILADYNIPGFGGTRALELARHARPQLPFIFVSGALGEERAIELMKLGATDYVLKGRLERLVPSVQRALREARESAERLQAEQRLRESEERYRLAMRATRDSLWDWDVRAGRITRNDGLREQFGYSVRELDVAGEWWLKAVHPEDLGRVLHGLQTAVQSPGVDRWEDEYRLRRKDGSYATVSDHGFVVRDEHGRATRMVGATQDVTERRAAEAEARQHAEFAQQLIGIVSHDLRNPLGAISLSASGLMNHAGLDERNAFYARLIFTSAERATRMVRDLLDFTRARLGGGIPLQRRAVDLYALVRQVLQEVGLNHSGREIREHYQDAGRGLWDADRLAQVLSNLVSNALQYSPNEGHVTVSVVGEAEAVWLKVHNIGDPIPDGLLGRLFEPLQRGEESPDNSRRSIGLGLYIVDQIVRAHGGTVGVRSSSEEGTTFQIHLPRMPPSVPGREG
ncbi:sensor histidine kinase [Archangium lansingense]|uniref:histidine kinase n=1 Tax=Archangium lansingense TaxID=2995310 RepID=A0ABT4A7K2_9BACT|nr:ATP-binding protein [Archangium lansinium]MCY1077590.1 ATP-binding protein [Archangium lansinium]